MTKTLTFFFSLCSLIVFAEQDHWTYLKFEDTLGVKIESTTIDSLWQIGTPHKTIFNSAYSGTKVIVTDTSNTYPTKAYSSFTIASAFYTGNGSWGGALDLSFWHKYNTDSLKDGGAILVSTDKTNWKSLTNNQMLVNDGYNWTWKNNGVVESLNDVGFSGNSGGWKQENLSVTSYIGYPEPDSVYFKFVFASDDIDSNKDGWMIDDITLWINLGVNIKDIERPVISFYPNPASTAIFTNNDKVVRLTVNNLQGKQLLESNQNSIDVSALPAGAYLVSAYTENGVLCKVINVTR